MSNLFLTGHRKSGTSMLTRLFDSHPELSVYPSDISLLYAYFPAFTASESNPDKLRQRISQVLEKSLDYGLSQSDPKGEFHALIRTFTEALFAKLDNESLRNKKAVLRAFISAWSEVSGADADTGIVLKETSQSIHFFELKEVLPTFKFFHLVRDPRDIYAAIKAGVSGYYSEFGEGERESLASVLNRFKVDTSAANILSATHQSTFLTLRFEDIVKNPESTMRKAAAFGNFSFDECLLSPSVAGAAYKGNSHDRIVMSGISSTNVGRWRERISDEEAMIIEFWLGAEMERVGYQRQFTESEAMSAFSKFYDWYNTKYFFSDSFSKKNEVGS